MKSRIMLACFLGLAWVALLTATSVWAERTLVIASKSVSVSSLDRATVSDIYQGKRTTWDNGDTIRVVMIKGGATHETFVREIVGTTPARLTDFWKKVVFTGTGTPPKILNSEAEMVEFVASNKAAIGYIDSSTPHEKVKVISVD